MIRLTTSGPLARAKELDSSPRVLPLLMGIEDRHGHRGIRQQVPAVECTGVRQEVQLEVRRIREERGVAVGPIPLRDRGDRAELCLGRDAAYDRPNPTLRVP